MKSMEDARLAALNMQFQGDMADYNKPTDFDSKWDSLEELEA